MWKWFKNKKAEEKFLLVNASAGCEDLNKAIREKWQLVSITNCGDNILCHLRKLGGAEPNILDMEG